MGGGRKLHWVGEWSQGSEIKRGPKKQQEQQLGFGRARRDVGVDGGLERALASGWQRGRLRRYVRGLRMADDPQWLVKHLNDQARH